MWMKCSLSLSEDNIEDQTNHNTNQDDHSQQNKNDSDCNVYVVNDVDRSTIRRNTL